MTAAPRLLDLYCGAGGSSRGFQMAGFTVVGVDIKPQPRYVGDEFHQADALEYLAAHGSEYDAIAASPPCQGYSIMHNLPWLRGREYPLLILPTLEMLEGLGKPYVLENVMGARHDAKGLAKRGLETHGLKAGWLCGWSFGRPFYRHRLFATNWLWLAPGHRKHTLNLHPRKERWVYGGHVKGLPGGAAGLDVRPRIVEVATIKTRTELKKASLAALQHGNGAQTAGVGVGHAKGWRLAAEAMGIDWMKRGELTQAIPPIFAYHVGIQLRAYLEGRHD